MRLGEVGEEALLERLLRVARRAWASLLPPGDDASGERLSGYTLLKIDGYAVSKARLPWMSLSDVGWKAVIAAASDVIAKGAKPRIVAVSMGAPREWSVESLEEMEEGIIDAVEYLQASFAGGDVNESREAWIDVAVVGVSRSPPLPLAAPHGSLIYTTTGRYGLTSLAYLRLMGEDASIPDWALRETARPEPRVGFLRLVEESGSCIVSATDVSDGLFPTLRRVARASNAYILVERLPTLHPVASRKVGDDTESIVKLLSLGGEEYEIVFAVKPECREVVEERAARLNISIELLGFVVHESRYIPSLGDRTIIQRPPCSRDKPIFIVGWGCLTGLEGWDQFRGWLGGKYR